MLNARGFGFLPSRRSGTTLDTYSTVPYHMTRSLTGCAAPTAVGSVGVRAVPSHIMPPTSLADVIHCRASRCAICTRYHLMEQSAPLALLLNYLSRCTLPPLTLRYDITVIIARLYFYMCASACGPAHYSMHIPSTAPSPHYLLRL